MSMDASLPHDYKNLSALLQRSGMLLRGGFAAVEHPELCRELRDRVERPVTVLLVGNVAKDIWPHFQRWRVKVLASDKRLPDHPLDAFAREHIEIVADAADGETVYPSDKPYLPFQRWGAHCESLVPSPIGPLMHPEYGTWHAYRGAIVLPYPIELPEPPEPFHLCDHCDLKPCLSTCPAMAFDDQGFDVDRCTKFLDFLHAEFAEPDCMSDGCEARRSCPYGRVYQYPSQQVAFHMRAFYAARKNDA